MDLPLSKTGVPLADTVSAGDAKRHFSTPGMTQNDRVSSYYCAQYHAKMLSNIKYAASPCEKWYVGQGPGRERGSAGARRRSMSQVALLPSSKYNTTIQNSFMIF